jgi:hypothetical protein
MAQIKSAFEQPTRPTWMVAPENRNVLQNFSTILVQNSAIAQNNSNVRARRENARVILENGREKSLAVLPANRSVRQNLSDVLLRSPEIAQNNSKVRGPPRECPCYFREWLRKKLGGCASESQRFTNFVGHIYSEPEQCRKHVRLFRPTMQSGWFYSPMPRRE